MTDVSLEIQKLKALINQKQVTSVFSNKSNETSRIVHNDIQLSVNDMTKKFSFSAAGVKAPIMIDPKHNTIENVLNINGTAVTDMINNIDVVKDEINDRIEGDKALDDKIEEMKLTYSVDEDSNEASITTNLNINGEVIADDYVLSGGGSLLNHEHSVKDIVDFEPYDDSALTNAIEDISERVDNCLSKDDQQREIITGVKVDFNVVGDSDLVS